MLLAFWVDARGVEILRAGLLAARTDFYRRGDQAVARQDDTAGTGARGGVQSASSGQRSGGAVLAGRGGDAGERRCFMASFVAGRFPAGSDGGYFVHLWRRSDLSAGARH